MIVLYLVGEVELRCDDSITITVCTWSRAHVPVGSQKIRNGERKETRK